MDWPTIVLGVLNAVILNFSERPLVWGPDLKQRVPIITIPEPTKASPFQVYATTVAAPTPSLAPEPRFGAQPFYGCFSWQTLLWLFLFAFLAACGLLAAIERAVVAKPPPPVSEICETAGSPADDPPPAAPSVCSEDENRSQLGDDAKAFPYADLAVQTETLPLSIDLKAFLETAGIMDDAFRMLDNAGDNSLNHKGCLTDKAWRVKGGTVDTHLGELQAKLEPLLQALPDAAKICLEQVSERAMLYRKYEILDRNSFHRGTGTVKKMEEWLRQICQRNFEWKYAEVDDAEEVMRQAGDLMDVQGLLEGCETRQQAPEDVAETKKEVRVKLPGREGVVVEVNRPAPAPPAAAPSAVPAMPPAAPGVPPAAAQAPADAPRGPRVMRNGGGICASRWAT